MKAGLGAHISYANVVATPALFVALGDRSYAALRVSGKEVKHGSFDRQAQRRRLQRKHAE